MKHIPLGELHENMYFDAPVFLAEGYILLSPDVQATPELMQRLERWGFDGVYSEGKPLEAPAHLSGARAAAVKSMLELDIKEKQQMEGARNLYFSLLNFTVENFKRFQESNRLDLAAISERVKQVIDMVKSGRDSLLRLPEFIFVSDNYLYQHSVNSAILSLVIGELLKLPPHRLIELGIGALLHDLGMLKLPEYLYLSSKPLEPKEWQMIKAHPMLGYRILKGFSVSDAIALTVWEHHERLNGSGYPRGLAGDKITLYSRILAVADSYDAITSKRGFKQMQEGHPGLLELLKGRKSLYEESMVKALIYCLSLFPLGSLVLLSNAAIGRVIRTNPRSPKAPIVQILIDKDGERLGELAVVQTAGEEGGPEPTVKRNLFWKEVEAHNLV
jgi:HD-GYP domain-containing protein (c-di-GMP phosphodiesterase class II)